MAHDILVGSFEHGLHLGVGVVASVGHKSLGVGLCQSVVGHLKGLHDVADERVQVVHIVGLWSDAEHGDYVGSGIFDLTPMGKQSLLEVSPSGTVAIGV